MLEKADKKVTWSSSSQDDLVDIGSYLTLAESQQVANRVVTDIEDAGERLRYQAHVWRPRDKIYPHARFVLVHSYVIVYIVEDTTATVLRVVHGARDIEAIFHTDDNPKL